MSTTSFERETIISYNQAESVANVYTSDPVLIRKLDKLLESESDISLKRRDNIELWAEYEVPKKWVSVRRPKQVNMTEEQRAAAAERMRAIKKKQTQTE